MCARATGSWAGSLRQKKRKGKDRNPIPISNSNSDSLPREIYNIQRKRNSQVAVLCAPFFSLPSPFVRALPRSFQRPPVHFQVTCPAAVVGASAPPSSSSSYYSPIVSCALPRPAVHVPHLKSVMQGRQVGSRPLPLARVSLVLFSVFRDRPSSLRGGLDLSSSGSDGPVCRHVVRLANVRTRGINTHCPCSSSSQTSTQRAGPLRLDAPDKRIETGVGAAAHDVGCSQGYVVFVFSQPCGDRDRVACRRRRACRFCIRREVPHLGS